MERRLRNRNMNSVNEIGSQTENDVALGRRQDVVSQVVIQRNLRQANTNRERTTYQEISSNGNRDDLHRTGPNEQPSDRSTETQSESRSNRRYKWTKEEYVGIIEAYYQAVESKHPSGMMAGTYEIWRRRNPNTHLEMNAVKLNNQRNYIIKSNKLTTHELENIRHRICNEVENNAHQVEEEITNNQDSNDQATEEHPRHSSLREEQNGNIIQPEDNEGAEFEAKLREKIAEVTCVPISERRPINKIRLCRTTEEQIKTANEAIKKIIASRHQDLTELNHIVYAAAALIAGEKKTSNRTSRTTNNNEPRWSMRINQQIKTYRKHISLLSEYKKNNGLVSKRVEKKLRQIMNGTEITSENITTLEQVLKMKLQAKAQRLKRYKKRRLQYVQNKLYEENKTKLFRQLNNQTAAQPADTPKKEEVENFWRSILENDQHHNDAEWIHRIKKYNDQIPQQNWKSVDAKDLKELIGKLHNWKAPGPDKIQNFWIKKITSVHSSLAHAYNNVLNNPEHIPKWLTAGSTYLLYKGKSPTDPKNYRPITCLPTMYKILTSILADRVYNHLVQYNILPIEQKGCRKLSQGCKDQLLIDKMVTETAKKKKHELSMAWIDYKKAFDSVPHSWIIEILSIYKINSNIINFIAKAMQTWKTQIYLFGENSSINIQDISIKRGIFQGDSLSPLLFCMAIAPLSQLLSRESIGYKFSNQNKISHLLYMDDLKIYTKDEYQLDQALKIVHEFSNDIRMDFGLDKCAKISIKHGRVVRKYNIIVSELTQIRELEHSELYKYLGTDEHNEINHESMRVKLKTEYMRRVRMILGSQLNAKNKIEAINTIAIPVLQYSFGIIEWTENALEKINRKTRKCLTMNGMHHPKADIHRLYLPRKEGGRGLIDLTTSWKISMVQIGNYINQQKDIYMSLVKLHENNKARYSVTKTCNEICRKYDSKETREVKRKIVMEKLSQYRQKPLHGQFISNVEAKQFCDKLQTFNWLRKSGLKGETESLLVAAQDQALNTRYHQRHILGQAIDSKCRLCHQNEEHISHIVSGCSILAGKQYLERHNRVATYIHWQLLKRANLEVSKKWYEHQPKPVAEKDGVTIMWDFPIITDRTISANRPDIVYYDKNSRECLLIDVAIPDDSNIAIKEAEKLSKYRDLEIEIHRMWKAKTSVIPVVIGALGAVTKRYQEHLSRIPCYISPNEIQKTAILGTAYVIRKFLDVR